ncbi:MAG TPA: tetratricopeptide repeat protein [Methanospirillum sp.]|uniref:tetratricopeptide repeat protein n=1 Tax=Methanospirillum sp. TaxID=45200 RepID=UPI002C007D8C|nr:tetratricopeptide repeat protein [Methanospirillum sp.]HWQ63085.1 tetratricopeptide repeat protein [Methanospirillum sp.]
MDLRKNKCLRQSCSPFQVSEFFSFLLILILSGVGICAADYTASDWNNQGESYYSSGDYDAATTAFMNAVAVNPNYAEAWDNLGKAYEQVGRYQDAVLAYRRAVAINPGYTEAWNNLGDVYEKLGRYEDARDAYQRATSITSDFSVPPMNQHPPNGQPGQYPGNQPAGPQMPGMNPGLQSGR